MITVNVRRASGTGDDKSMNHKLAKQLKRQLQRYTPVRTGKLRRGWTITKVNSRSFTLENSVYYGAYVEDGTATISPRRFTRRAVAHFERAYATELQNYNNIIVDVVEP